MPTDQFDGPTVIFVVFFVVVALLIVVGVVSAAFGIGRRTSVGGRASMLDDLGAREHRRLLDQQGLDLGMQHGMGGMPPETGMHGGGHHHVDHTPPPSPPST